MPLKLSVYRNQIKKQLENAGVDSPAFEVALLFEKVFSLSRLQMLNCQICLNEDSPTVQDQMEKMNRLVEQRVAGYPLQYLLGEWEFFGFPFFVGEGVLIPRSDTEVVVEKALDLLRDKKSPRVLDLCSGSGCIAIALAHERPDCQVAAVELSEQAWPYLLKNTQRNQSKNVTPYHGDALDSYVVPGMFDLIVSNPPYIRPQAMDQLSVTVKYEPEMALKALEDGLYFYKRLTHIWKNRLFAGGNLLYEIGFDQREEVCGIFKAEGFCNIKSAKDYGGNDRMVWATYETRNM